MPEPPQNALPSFPAPVQQDIRVRLHDRAERIKRAGLPGIAGETLVITPKEYEWLQKEFTHGTKIENMTFHGMKIAIGQGPKCPHCGQDMPDA